ncbi:hypothetical protein [Carnobacterium funditum]|uniref:hypothetical protein n=1 Tax=Carnobacterium funditum TaxID=2752 RepID=UPI00068F1012|nr:hypothetical protein [Carnobacterium funditum]
MSVTDDMKRWENTIELTPEQIDAYLGWLEQEIEKRADAIVGGGYRKVYYKVADLIVLLGEVLESNGKSHKKVAMMEYYKKTYARKSAFIKELTQLT